MGVEQRLNLIELVETRWNSEFKMIQRMVKLKKPLSAIFEIKKLKFKNKFSESEWNLLENLIMILQPFHEATECMSGSKYPTLSMAIPVLFGIQDALKILEETSQDVLPLILRLYINGLENNLNRFSSIKKNNLYIKAMVLDPRFRCQLLNDLETIKIIDDISLEIFKLSLITKQSNSVLSTGMHNKIFVSTHEY